MTFEDWITECRALLVRTAHLDEASAQRMIEGAGLEIYRDKFNLGLTPERCVDDELMMWNE